MTRAFALGLSLFACALSGCSVTALAERERTTAVNECTSSSECSGGFCADGMCLSRGSNANLSHLLFELTPITTAAGFGGKPVYLESAVPGSGEFDLDFNGFSNVEVKVTVPELCHSATFVPSDPAFVVRVVEGTIPARITLIPSYGRLGLPADEYRAEVNTIRHEIDNGDDPHQVSFPAAIGAYDVYIEPRSLSASSQNDPLRSKCTLPPQLVLQHSIASGALSQLPIDLPSPAPLGIQVRLPTAYSLVGWKLDIVEPEAGRLISTAQTIPAEAKSPYDLTPPLYYYPVWPSGTPKANTSATELVRLSPPQGVLAPTFFYQRKAIEIFDVGSAVIEPPAALPAPVTFEAQVLAQGGGSPVSASVVLTAKELVGVGSGVFASFGARTKTDENGRFSVTLLPGKYRVRALPDGDPIGYAAAEADWEVAETPRRQAGRTLEVRSALELTGQALLGWGDRSGAFGAVVVAEPSALEPRPSALERALGEDVLRPRFGSGPINDVSGDFGFFTDFGKVDVYVRPPDSSNLPWFVRAGIDVVDAGEAAMGLGSLSLPLPIRLEGDVRILSAPMHDVEQTPARYRPAQSLLRAYVLLDENGQYVSSASSARTALPIAETRIDGNDRYTLFVPGSLNVSVKPLN